MMKPRTMPVHCGRTLALVVLMALLPSTQARSAALIVNAAMPCEHLASVALPNTTVTSAQTIAAGTFALPGAAVAAAPDPRLQNLPAFCRVAAKLKPSADSDINIEVWLPMASWNGKYLAVGNGAFSGTIDYAAMTRALARGYATSGTDTGHAGNTGSFGLGHPEKVIDFGWRAVHEMTVTSKKLIAAYYSADPTFSYWNGCSAGGRQGMKEAEQFPADFDGIIAGAPGLDWTGRAAQAVRAVQALQKNEAAQLSAANIQQLHKAVLQACDSLDGVTDGLIEDPKQCRFDPGALQCKDANEALCLTPPQVSTARMLYSARVNPKTGREVTGLEPGSELGWTNLGWTASARATGLDEYRFLVFSDPQWDVHQFNFETDIVRAEETDNNTINALDPNLKGFIDRGGKLIQYHGWSDPQISPGNSTQYYRRVLEALDRASEVQNSYRLFMAPGMGHCGGGEGPNTFDMLAALEQWVEKGKAPDQISASHSTNGQVDRTRPLCPYPQVARYKGSGSIDDAANFVCRTP